VDAHIAGSEIKPVINCASVAQHHAMFGRYQLPLARGTGTGEEIGDSGVARVSRNRGRSAALKV
jgi:hypothetical protein